MWGCESSFGSGRSGTLFFASQGVDVAAEYKGDSGCLRCMGIVAG